MFKKLLLASLICLAAPQCFAANIENLLPVATDFILRVNVQELMKMPEIQSKISEAEKLAGTQQYTDQMKAIGFDPTKDIHNVSIFVPSALVAQNDPQNSPVGVVVEGNLNVESTLKAIEEKNSSLPDNQKITVSKENGLTILNHPGDKNGPVSGIIVDDKTIVFGTVSGIDQVKSVLAGKATNLAIKKDFVASLNKLSSNAQVSGLFGLSPEMKSGIAANPQAGEFAKLSFLRFNISKAKDLEIELIGDFEASANVETCKAMVDGLLAAFGQSKTPYQALDEALKNLTTTVNSNSLVLKTKISNEAIESLIAAMAAQKGAMAAE